MEIDDKVKDFFDKFDKKEFTSFLWSLYIFSKQSEDIDYLYIVKKIHKRNSIKWEVIKNDFGNKDSEIILFLNRWRTHVEKNQENNLLKVVKKYEKKIGKIGEKIDEEAENIYLDLVNLKNKKRFGPTATSKFLHILRPDYFAMWDSPIRSIFYKKSNSNHKEFYDQECCVRLYSEYCKYLRETVKKKIEGFSKKDKKLWKSLKRILNYKITKKPLKLIDEYLWIRFTGEYYRIKKGDGRIGFNEVFKRVLNSNIRIEPPEDFLELSELI